ncbi:hypothetical protein JYU34_013980 [Plutella xylostella]|uniref:Major facilitator superfamily (MFS) profile domain-containing protein n=1 Tax=Plutella xylostella TaxID=51655 RepID=A0ABQ7Q7C6_PLUXY|nr:hypothetical protein JYU34_013980 [Plutella xylostella]
MEGGALDAVLERLGGGRHQAATLAMISLVYATNSMYNVNYVFAVDSEVGYRCKVPSCPLDGNLTGPVTITDGVVKQCQVYSRGDTCGGSFNTSLLEPCLEWDYDVKDSFIAEFGLACDEWKQSLVGTAHNFGSMLGLLLQGQISDRFGRKKAAVFAGSMGAVLGLMKSFSTSFRLYVFLETLEAAIGDALSPIFMLSIEIVPKKHAIFTQMILLNCYTGGLILMALVAWAVPYWRHFLRAIYAPTLVILVYSLFLEESIRWLFSKGKREEAIKLIQKIAKRNNVEIDKMTLNRLDYIDADAPAREYNDKKLLLKTFRSRVMLRRFLVCLVWWFTITLINYGMMISSVFIDGNKYVNFALLMLMDIPANVLYWLILVKYKRKIPLLTSFLIGGMFCVTQPFLPKGYAWLGLALLMAFEMLATLSYNIVYLYTSELFPTYTRNSVHSFCSSVGRAGALLAPQAPLLMSYWAGLPPLLFGLTSLLSGLLTLGMPETAHTELPDTVEQAELIGKKPTPDKLTGLTSDMEMKNGTNALMN